MRLTLRVLALPLVMALMGLTTLPVTEYICRFTGARMTACCCPPAPQGPGAIARACCCDVRLTSGVVDPCVVDGLDAAAVTSATFVVLHTSTPWLVGNARRVSVAPGAVVADRPPDRGRPVYLTQHRLLI